jgi:hypothetical protein
MAPHAEDNRADRDVGEKWEAEFEKMANSVGGLNCHRPTVPGRLLPDRVVQRKGEIEWHELKHKRATWADEYGLEQYRYEALIELAKRTGETVLYTIHDWRLAGARDRDDKVPNAIDDWYTVDVLDLPRVEPRIREGKTYYGGRVARTPIFYWPAGLWSPLAWRWGLPGIDKHELTEVLWAIVRAGKDLNATGHGRVVRWARAHLFDDRPDVAEVPE